MTFLIIFISVYVILSIIIFISEGDYTLNKLSNVFVKEYPIFTLGMSLFITLIIILLYMNIMYNKTGDCEYLNGLALNHMPYSCVKYFIK